MDPSPESLVEQSGTVLILLWISSLLVFAGIGGVTQELFARGFLLPRIQQIGAWSPLFNATVFAVFHLASPWNWPVFLLVSLIWAYLVWKLKSMWIGVFAHIGMLLIQTLMLGALFLFGGTVE